MAVVARAEARLEQEEKVLASRYAAELARETRQRMEKLAASPGSPVLGRDDPEDGDDEDDDDHATG